jgi:DNA-directed RNA polymerase specialized sigma24 family protein
MSPSAFDSWWLTDGCKIAYSKLRRSGLSRDDADEYLDEVYLWARQRIGRYDEARSKLTTWLCVMCQHTMLQKWRRKIVPLVPLSEAWQNADQRCPSEDGLVLHAEATRVERCLQERDRKAVRMRAEGHLWKDVTKACGLTREQHVKRVHEIANPEDVSSPFWERSLR